MVATLYDATQVDDPAAFSDYIAAPRGGPAHQEEVRTVLHDVMDKAVTEGRAIMIGELPDAPAKYEGEYWTRTGDDWVLIESDDTIAYLRDAERRMLLADDAVRRTEQS